MLNAVRATGHSVTEQIFNICMNYANYVKAAHELQQSYFSRVALALLLTVVSFCLWSV